MVDEISIENKLKELRKTQCLSQEELAEHLGISRQSIIALEQGHTMPSLPLAVSICQFFNTAFEDVFEFEREMDRQFDQIHNEIADNLSQSESDKKVIKISSGNPTSPRLRGAGPEGKENAMIELEPWRPFREAVTLRDAVDRLFEDSIITPGRAVATMPKVDIKDKKEAIVVRAELPGIAEEDVNVEILDNVITISGEKKDEKESPPAGGDKGYYYKESHSGAFSRSFTLPSDVKAEKAIAEMKNGVLTITVPKIEPKKASKVKIAKK